MDTTCIPACRTPTSDRLATGLILHNNCMALWVCYLGARLLNEHTVHMKKMNGVYAWMGVTLAVLASVATYEKSR